MLTLVPNLYLRVEQLPGGPTPLPLNSGFSNGTAYRALGMFNPAETSDAYFIFSNDRDEIWFICNRHLRAVGLIDSTRSLRLSLPHAEAAVMAAWKEPQPHDAPPVGLAEAAAAHAIDTEPTR